VEKVKRPGWEEREGWAGNAGRRKDQESMETLGNKIKGLLPSEWVLFDT